MPSSMRKIIDVANTCKKAVWACLKSVLKMKLFGSKRSKIARDVIDTVTAISTEMPQGTGSPATTDLSGKTVLVSSVHEEIVQTSADNNHTLTVNKIRAKTQRRKRVKPGTEKLPHIKAVVVDDKSQNTDHDLHAVECGHVTEICGENERHVVSEQTDGGEDAEFWRIIGKVRKQRAGHSHRVPCAEEKQSANMTDRTSSKPTEISVSLRREEQTDHKNKPADAFEKSRGKTDLTKLSERSSSGHKKRAKRLQRNNVNLEAEKLLPVNVDKSGPATRNPTDSSCSNDDQETCKSRDVMEVSEQAEDREEVSELWRMVAKPRKRHVDQSDDVLCAKEQLRINKPDQIKPCYTGKSLPIRFQRHTKTAHDKKSTDKQCSSLRELNNNIKFILNTITTENIAVLSKNFAALPIDTIESLDNAVDLVFEKAIRKQSVTHLCAVLCSAMKPVNVTYANSKRTTSFQAQILRKCQGSFEADKANRTESAKKLAEIKACKNPKKKKELQFGYDENEERWRKLSVGNCRFIGELFNQRVLRISILEYCIEYLTSQRSDNALECLCSLLKTIGKESEQCGDLNKTLDTLKDLNSDLSISSRVRFMIREIIDLQRNRQ